MLSSLCEEKIQPPLTGHHSYLYDLLFPLWQSLRTPLTSALGSSSSLSIGHCSLIVMDWPRLHSWCSYKSSLIYMHPWLSFNPSNNDSTSVPRAAQHRILTLISEPITKIQCHFQTLSSQSQRYCNAVIWSNSKLKRSFNFKYNKKEILKHFLFF